MAGCSFKNPEVCKKATEAAHTPEAIKKREKTKAENRLIRDEIYNSLKQSLLASDGRSKSPFYEQYLNAFLKEAKKNPGGKCGAIIGNVIFQQDLLELLDEQQNKAMARDLDFMRFRSIKRLFKEQRDVVMDVDKRRKIIFCSRRAGKTDSNSTNLLYTCITPNSPCLYINKTFSNAINQMWDLVIEQAEGVGLEVADGTSKSEGMIIFSNGSSIKFSGNSNNAEADKLRGGKYRLVIIDEAGHQGNLKYMINEVLEPALMDFDDSIMVLSGTPPRVPHTYVEKLWNESGYEHYHWTLHRNPYIHNVDEEIERICKEKGVDVNSSFIQREYFGKMGCYDTEAQVFKGRHTVESISTEKFNFKPTNVCVGVDFGWSDYNGIVTLVYNRDTRQSCVVKQAKFNKSTITDIVDAIKAQYEVAKGIAIRYGIDLATVDVFCDNNEKSIVSELVRVYNVNAHCAWKYDKTAAMEQLAEELRTGRMVIEKGSHLDDEMDQILYKRDDNDNIIPELDEDLGIHPDITMALLYASRQMFMDYGYTTGGRTKEEKL